MAYNKNTWVDQSVERPRTYEIINNADGSITLVDSYGLVTELGTPVNADYMNHIEEGIAGAAIRYHNMTETFNETEWVVGVVSGKKSLYKSLQNENTGHVLTESDWWEEVNLDNIASDLNNKADRDLSNCTSSTFVDGQWTKAINSLSTATAVGTYVIDLSSILPNDGCDYEILIGAAGQGQESTVFTISANGKDGIPVALAQPYKYSLSYRTNALIPIGIDRIVKYNIGVNAVQNSEFDMMAYRRLGTNQ